MCYLLKAGIQILGFRTHIITCFHNNTICTCRHTLYLSVLSLYMYRLISLFMPINDCGIVMLLKLTPAMTWMPNFMGTVFVLFCFKAVNDCGGEIWWIICCAHRL